VKNRLAATRPINCRQSGPHHRSSNLPDCSKGEGCATEERVNGPSPSWRSLVARPALRPKHVDGCWFPWQSFCLPRLVFLEAPLSFTFSNRGSLTLPGMCPCSGATPQRLDATRRLLVLVLQVRVLGSSRPDHLVLQLALLTVLQLLLPFLPQSQTRRASASQGSMYRPQQVQSSLLLTRTMSWLQAMHLATWCSRRRPFAWRLQW
jgi:hypothetical protein